MSKFKFFRKAVKTVGKVKKFLTTRRGSNFKPLTRTRGQKAKRLFKTAFTSRKKKVPFSFKNLKSRIFNRSQGPSNKQIVSARKRLAKSTAVIGAIGTSTTVPLVFGRGSRQRKKSRSRR